MVVDRRLLIAGAACNTCLVGTILCVYYGTAYLQAAYCAMSSPNGTAASQDDRCAPSKTHNVAAGYALIISGIVVMYACATFCCCCCSFYLNSRFRVAASDAAQTEVELVVVSADDDACCCICLEAMTEAACLTACGHTFHTRCIARWLSRKRACPLCARPL